jgi:hypothetical protein
MVTRRFSTFRVISWNRLVSSGISADLDDSTPRGNPIVFEYFPSGFSGGGFYW